MWWIVGCSIVALVAVAILVAIVAALWKTDVEIPNREEAEKIGGVLRERLHWPEAADIFSKIGADDKIGVWESIKAVWRQLQGDGIWAILTKITVKSISAILHNTDHQDGASQKMAVATAIAVELPFLMKDDDTATLVDETIESEVLGTSLGADGKAKMVLISQRANAWGLGDFGAIFYAIGSDNESAVRVSVDAIYADFQSDDALRAAIKNSLSVIIPRLKQDPNDKQWLTNLVAA